MLLVPTAPPRADTERSTLNGSSTPDRMSFPEEATHPRCYGEGYPDWPGRASNKEGES